MVFNEQQLEDMRPTIWWSWERQLRWWLKGSGNSIFVPNFNIFFVGIWCYSAHHILPHHCHPDSHEHHRTLRSSSGCRSHSCTYTWLQSRLFLTNTKNTLQLWVIQGWKAIHTAQKKYVRIHTLSAVILIYSIGAVCLSIAHKQWMQRTVATTVLCWPRCEDMQHFSNAWLAPQAEKRAGH